jgi:hypothetical protein
MEARETICNLFNSSSVKLERRYFMKLFRKTKKIVFIIKDDKKGQGFTLSTKLKGDVKMEHFRAIASYTNSKYNEYANQITKANREAKRAAYKNRG